MPNTVQLTKNGQPVYPVTDVSLITGLEERSGMRVIPYSTQPTASADTVGFIYMDEDTQDLYVTKATSGSYTWVSAGNLSDIDLDDYATKNELNQLGQEMSKGLNKVASEFGICYAFSVDNSSTDESLSISGVEPGVYCVSLKCTGSDVPSSIRLYRTKNNRSSIIDPTKYDIQTNGNILEIEVTSETNYLWFFINQSKTYSADFYLVKKSALYKDLIASINKNATDIGNINSSINTINSNINAINEDIVDIKNDLNGIQNEVEAIIPTIVVYKEMTIFRTDENQFLNSSGNEAAFNGYNVLVYDVEGVSKVKIVGHNAASTVRAYGFYDGSTIGSTALVGTIGPEMSSDYEYELPIPTGATHLAVTKYNNQSLSVAKETTQEDKSTKSEIKVENGNKVSISVPSANKKLYLIIGPTASGIGNGLIDFRYWGYADIQSGVEDTPTKLYESSSDCFAPFQVSAQNNIDGDDTSHMYFTGGSHQYNNDLSGSTPTARLGNVDIRVDGVKRTNFIGRFTSFEMTWENYIQATNTRKANGTGREVLKEIINLQYVNGEFLCCTEIVPLEDITLHLFYGYQICGINPGGVYSLSDHWKYIEGVQRGLDELTSGNKDTMAMIGYTAQFCQEMWVNTSIDLGKRNLCSAGTINGAFKAETGSKGYFTIANSDATLVEANSYYLFGKYVFMLKEISS